jgi:hypothetical protein
MIRHRKIPEVAGTMPDRVQLELPIHIQREFSKKVFFFFPNPRLHEGPCTSDKTT